LGDGAGLFGPAPEDKASLTKYHGKLRRYRIAGRLALRYPVQAKEYMHVITVPNPPGNDGRLLPKIFMAIAIVVITACIFAPGRTTAAAGPAPIPAGLEKARLASPDAIAEAFLGLPYRADGAINAAGEYTLFADQTRRFSTPGLNCSGLVLALSRFLLGSNITLEEALRDRLGDSGPSSPHGEDWDFGWDLILNISEGFPRRFLLSGGETRDPAGTDGFSPRGYDIHAEQTGRELPARFVPGHLYLISLNVEGRRKGYGLQHYHVGIVHVASGGQAWFYQTTSKGGGVNRRDLKSAQGWDSFTRAFANTGKHRKMMLVLEVDLPRK